MNLSVSEAARLLGKTERQVRYLIKSGGLPARKDGKQWSIRRADLPLSEGQRKASAQKERRAAVLEIQALTGGKKLSVRDTRAYQVGVPLYRDLKKVMGAEHPAVAQLHEALSLVACGFFEFHGRDKNGYYSRAREQASRSAMTLLLDDEEGRDDLVQRFESLLLPAIGGLIRKSEGWRSRR